MEQLTSFDAGGLAARLMHVRWRGDLLVLRVLRESREVFVERGLMESAAARIGERAFEMPARRMAHRIRRVRRGWKG